MPNPFARAMRVAGDKNAGAILYRLSYWQPKTKIRIGPHTYVAMTRQQWMEETALSLDCYNRGLKLLVKKGLVCVEHHLRNSVVVAYLRLSDEAQELLNAPYQKACEIADMPQPVIADLLQGGGKYATTGYSKDATTIISEIKKGDYKGDYLQVSSELSLAPAEAEHEVISGEAISEDTVGTVETMGTVKGKSSGKTIAELLAETPSKPVAKKGKVSTTQDLNKAWRESVSEAIAGYVPPLTMKQIGQLKHFSKACPPGASEAVMRCAVENWMDFAMQAQASAGIKSAPTAPNIDFLLKHVGVAVNLYIDLPKTQPQQEAKVSGTQNAAAMKLIALTGSKKQGGAS